MPEMHFWLYCKHCGWQTAEPDTAIAGSSKCPQCGEGMMHVRFTNAEWYRVQQEVCTGQKTLRQWITDESPADDMPAGKGSSRDEDALLDERCYIEKKRLPEDSRFDVLTAIIPNPTVRGEPAEPEFKFTGQRARLRFLRLCIAQSAGALSAMEVDPEIVALLKHVYDMLRMQEANPEAAQVGAEQRIVTPSSGTKH